MQCFTLFGPHSKGEPCADGNGVSRRQSRPFANDSASRPVERLCTINAQ